MPVPSSLPELSSPQQLSEFVQLPVKTLYRMNQLNTGPRAVRLGKHLRYRREDVEAWLEQRSASA